jgi:antitoxin HicB
MANPEVERRIGELLDLPYRKVIRGDAEDGYLGKVPELPGCVTAGETEAEALTNLREAMAAWFEEALETGLPIPEPQSEPKRYSGKLLVRLPSSLHGQLAERAREEGVSTNQMTLALIAEGLGARRARPAKAS